MQKKYYLSFYQHISKSQASPKHCYLLELGRKVRKKKDEIHRELTRFIWPHGHIETFKTLVSNLTLKCEYGGIKTENIQQENLKENKSLQITHVEYEMELHDFID